MKKHKYNKDKKMFLYFAVLVHYFTFMKNVKGNTNVVYSIIYVGFTYSYYFLTLCSLFYIPLINMMVIFSYLAKKAPMMQKTLALIKNIKKR